MKRLLDWILAFIVFVLAVGVFYRLLVAYLLPHATVTSWWRSIFKNWSVHGVYNSRHLWGWAFDIVPATNANVKRLKPFFKDVLIHDAGSGVHIHAEVI